MEERKPMDLGNRIHLIDGNDLGMDGRTGTYVIQEEQLTIVETSASPSVPYILKGFQELGLDPKNVKYIIVTHIHLDHAGGAGLLLQHCPQAKVVVHPKGARHLADPERLIMGARAVYGDQFDKLFHPILPVPEDRILVKDDQETLAIGPNCELRFLDTPGHANHHFSIYDPVSNGIFTGDTLGVYYHQLRDQEITFCLPSTSPNQFNPQAMLQSLERIQKMQVGRIYFGHYGMSTEVETVYQQIKEWLPCFIDTAEKVVREGGDHTEVSSRLMQQIRHHLAEKNVSSGHSAYNMMQLDIDVCSMGLVDYITRQNK